ncbi:MAG: hypothetical protein RL341_787 [Pseudomonadota bacterium]|jgi:hypothetical protein
MNREEKFASKVRLALNQSANRLDDRVIQRLEKARVLAVARRKQDGAWRTAPVLAPALARGGSLDEPSNWWLRAGWVVPAVAVILGLVWLHQAQQSDHAAELAKIDAEMLADDLPISAYLDKGFTRYLQQGE